ncbi:hypothetical protein MNBD_NITROSPINAE04-1586 [hydrothermal vent metagenome]|uniref:SPOR domain-containing protein n=1 Tax=hydrothermal vent metagenome TaxID=652676 RepID=A0A3B1CKE7_9ZZZZ
MKKFNMLVEAPNIRNTIQRDTRTPGQRPRLRSLVPVVVLLALLAGVTLWPILKNNQSAQPQAAFIKKTPEEKPLQTTEKIGVASLVEPEKTSGKDSGSDEKLKPIVSRPVAKDAALVATKTVVNDIWVLRFGLCFYKKSCESIQERLKKMGMPAYITKSTTNLLAHRVVVGPWAMASVAEDVREKVEKSGIVSASFSAEDKYYLSTSAVTRKKQAKARLKKIQDLGYRAKLVSKREPFEVYKVYGKSFNNEKKAKIAMQNFLFSRIECVLERRRVK